MHPIPQCIVSYLIIPAIGEEQHGNKINLLKLRRRSRTRNMNPLFLACCQFLKRRSVSWCLQARKTRLIRETKTKSPRSGRGLDFLDPRKSGFLCDTESYFFAVSALAYFRRKRSTRPAVSTSFCLPVKNGWQFEQISTAMSPLWVDRVINVLPQAQCTRTSLYAG